MKSQQNLVFKIKISLVKTLIKKNILIWSLIVFAKKSYEKLEILNIFSIVSVILYAWLFEETVREPTFKRRTIILFIYLQVYSEHSLTL